jgi:serine protease Do
LRFKPKLNSKTDMLNPLKKIAPLFVAGVLGSAATLGAYKMLESQQQSATVFTEAPPKTYFVDNRQNGTAPFDFTIAAEKATPTVVHIRSTMAANPSARRSEIPEQFRDFFGDDFFLGPQSRTPQQASGSGVIISADGYIVTNNHVIDEANEVKVVLYDKREYTARVIGTDPSTDLAVIKIDEKNLPPILFANSDEVKVGQWVLAVGNPFNLTSTVTAGIVSAKGRSINILDRSKTPIESFIQTDAAVNPGNSGGALVNLEGNLVGINTAIASQTGTFAGYAFAVPVNLMKKVVDDLVKFGTVQRGLLGVVIRDVDARLVREEKLKTGSGIYVDSLATGSAAGEAGIKSGDVITQVEGVSVGTTPQLQEQIGRHRPGDKVRIVVNRFGTEKEFLVTLKNRDGKTGITKKESLPVVETLGADFDDISAKDRKDNGLEGGVKVTRLFAGGKLRQYTEMREGFIITKVDSTPVKSLSELNAALEKHKGGDVVLKGVYPGSEKVYYYAFSL